jgi:hypothetical protein
MIPQPSNIRFLSGAHYLAGVRGMCHANVKFCHSLSQAAGYRYSGGLSGFDED